MNQKINQVFKNIPEIEPTFGLESRIFRCIELEKTGIAKRNLMFYRAGLFSSLVVFLASALVFGKDVLQSEFFSLISLAFSDAAIVAQNWKEFSYSLLETFPAVYAAIIIVPVFTLLLSFNGYLNNHNHSRHYNAT